MHLFAPTRSQGHCKMASVKMQSYIVVIEKFQWHDVQIFLWCFSACSKQHAHISRRILAQTNLMQEGVSAVSKIHLSEGSESLTSL
jgi:hypothetical protein